MEPQISVIIPTCNQLQTIYQTIDSVLAQDYNHIQILVVDDATSNFNVNDIEKYVIEHQKGNIESVGIYTNERNLGTVKNMNRAFQYVTGEFLTFLAGDDVFYDNKVLSNYVLAFTESENADVIVSQVKMCNSDISDEGYDYLNYNQIEVLKRGDNREIFSYLCGGCFIPAIGCAYRVQSFGMQPWFDEGYYYVEDWPFHLKQVRNGKKYMAYDWVSTRHRDGGVSHVKKSKKEEYTDKYHMDLIRTIRNEIFPYYEYALEQYQNRVFHDARDRLLISEYRLEISSLSLKKKCGWFMARPELVGTIFRGIARKLGLRGNE